MVLNGRRDLGGHTRPGDVEDSGWGVVFVYVDQLFAIAARGARAAVRAVAGDKSYQHVRRRHRLCRYLDYISRPTLPATDRTATRALLATLDIGRDRGPPPQSSRGRPDENTESYKHVQSTCERHKSL